MRFKLINKICLAAVLLISGAFIEAAEKKVLFLAGKRSHGPGEHEHRAGSLLLADALNKSGLQIEAKVISIWPKDLKEFDDVDAVVVYADAGGKFNKAKLQLLDERIKAGMGIMFIHYGVHPSKAIGEEYFLPWLGGFFETGWSVNPHWTADISPKKDHPIAHGISKPILVNDEFYFNMRFPKEGDCQDCYPLAKSPLTPERVTNYNNLWNEHGDALFGTEQTLMWCRDPKGGAGRGIGFTGGHFHRNWAIDDLRKMVLNGIAWISHVEVPTGGVPSAKISEEVLNQNLDREPAKKLTIPIEENIRKMEAMLRPEDPANYHQKKHLRLLMKEKNKKK